MASFTMCDGILRLYDSTGTPFYLGLTFVQGNLTAPEGRKRPEEKIIFDRGRGDTNTHYVLGPDDPIVEPLELSYSIRIPNVVATHNYIMLAHSNTYQASPWSINSHTWVTTKATSTLTAGDAATFTDPAFADASKKCVNVEILWTFGGISIGRKYTGVYFSPDQLSLAESEDGLILSATGLIYGTVSSITAFTAGTDTTV